MQQTTLRTTQRVTATTTTRVTRRQKRPKVAPKRPNKPLEFEMPEVTTTVASLSEVFGVDNSALSKDGIIGGPFTCWTCHASSFDQCESTGSAVQCASNQDTCGLELRKRNRGEISEVRMGCTQRNQCESNKRQNFNHPRFTHTQCRPEDMFGQSVCRQCCHQSYCNRGTAPGTTPAWFNPTAKYQSRVDWAADRA